MQADAGSYGEHGCSHDSKARDEDRAAAPPVDKRDGNEGREDVRDADDYRRPHLRVVRAEPGHLHDLRAEVHDDVDAGQLLHELQPELIVVAAFGQFLSKEILELPKYGCINVHASLLPKYRGAAPIQYAIIKGEKESGVTIMQMDIGMDTGAMLDKVVVPIEENTTMGELHYALREQGAALLLQVIDKIAAGTAVAEPQDNEQATYATLLDRSMEHIDWSKTAQEVHNLIRGFNPAPSTFTKLPNGKGLKIWGSKMTDKNSAAAAGTVIETGKHSFFVACGEGVLEITEVQPESKKRMPAQVFLNGRGVQEGDLLA